MLHTPCPKKRANKRLIFSPKFIKNKFAGRFRVFWAVSGRIVQLLVIVFVAGKEKFIRMQPKRKRIVFWDAGKNRKLCVSVSERIIDSRD